jgi:hypothetical protein
MDLNWNWIWDVCDNWKDINYDKDNDGILDDDDMCPNIPESIDWNYDKDGCPEINNVNKTIKPFVQTQNCTQCPCQNIDYGSQLWKWDDVRAILFDITWNVLYRYSWYKEITENVQSLDQE